MNIFRNEDSSDQAEDFNEAFDFMTLSTYSVQHVKLASLQAPQLSLSIFWKVNKRCTSLRNVFKDRTKEKTAWPLVESNMDHRDTTVYRLILTLTTTSVIDKVDRIIYNFNAFSSADMITDH